METVLRESFIDRLNNSWQPYITRFQKLSAAEQSAFLQKQGYRSFSSLLAHIIAWWRDGALAIEQMRQDPNLPLADYNVDDFNARAVQEFTAYSEAEVLLAFETQRQAMLALVSELPDSQLFQSNINTRLYYEILMHWDEHTLETPLPFHGPLKKNAANPRYFTDDSGRAIYLTGSHTWAVMQDMWPENEAQHAMDYAAFLQMLEDNGHNFMRFWQFAFYTKNCPWNNIPTRFDPMAFERTGPGLARDGLPKFDLTRPSKIYFNRLRARVQQAVERGIYASIMLFEAWALKWATPDQQPWEYHMFNPANNINQLSVPPKEAEGKYAGNYIGIFTLDYPDILEVQKRFIRSVVDAVNDLDNVLYEMCNEVPNTPEALTWQSHLCSYLREYEQGKPKQHMIGITPEGGDQINAELFDTPADWISPSNGRGFEYRYNPPPASGEKVIVNDTDHLWGHGCELGWIWKSFTRGMNVLLMDPWEPIPGDLDWWQDGDITRNQRYYYAWDDMRRNLGYTRNIALSYDLNRCVPDLTFCTSTYCLANKNEQYVCFFPSGGTEGLNLSGLDGEFQVEWLNPVTGIIVKGEALQARSNSPHAVYQRAALRAPFDGPAVLLLYKQRKPLPKKRSIYVAGQ